MSKLKKYFRDNVHGDILVNDRVIYELIDTNAFQRLRRIEQLGGAKYVFLGANHTRFSHCIGVYSVVCKFLANDNISTSFTDRETLVLKISGLLHDIGHGPFSHTFERLLVDSEVPSHEQYSSKIIREDNEISSILKKHKIDPQEVCDVIEGKNKKLSPLISSQVDADRIDYLLRDGLLVGVNYAASDIEWIIRNTSYKDDQMIFSYKACGSLESYLLGRYHMYKQVYLHKTSIEFDVTLRAWFERLTDLYNNGYAFIGEHYIETLKELIEKKAIPVDKFFLLDDFFMISFFKVCLNEKDHILKDLSSMLVNRKFLKVIENCDDTKYNNLIESIKNKEEVRYFARKEEENDVCLYKTKTDFDEIKIIHKDGTINKLTDISLLIKDSKKDTDSKKNKKYMFLIKKEYIL